MKCTDYGNKLIHKTYTCNATDQYNDHIYKVHRITYHVISHIINSIRVVRTSR